jgi:hypothetical protein
MRCALITFVALAVTYFASGTQASARDWRFLKGWFRGRYQPIYKTVDAGQVTKPAPARPDDGAPVATPTPLEMATNPAYRSLSDEQKCALLGRETAHMVYPDDDDIDPYPACRAWKWDDEDGCSWDWSELNCPWKQCPDCDND